jgi:hypothetical protein
VTFWRSKIVDDDPYGQLTVTLTTRKVSGDPLAHIKDAIWHLIRSNCYPRRRETFDRKQDPTPVREVTVQTFYVDYPSGDKRLDALGRSEGREISREITKEMVEEGTYEPYLIDKIGQADWDQAGLNDEQNIKPGRVEAAWNARIVEVFVQQDLKRADGDIRVVGRESLAMERTQQRQLGRDPKVLAVITVGNSAFTNPHLREFLNSRTSNRPIYILEGRNARKFLIGANPYDDIQVPGMPVGERYVLEVSASEATPIKARLSRSGGAEIPANNGEGTKWSLSGDGNNNVKWFCELTFTSLPPEPVSKFKDAPEVPPTIQLNGRVLPRTTATRKLKLAGLESGLRGRNASSAITLERDLILYAANDDSEVFLLNNDQNRSVTVSNSRGERVDTTERGYVLEENSTIEVGNQRYKWEFQAATEANLPSQVVGMLRIVGDSKDRLVEVMEVSPREGDTRQWMLGNWRQGSTGAFQQTCIPIFINNPDLYLSRSGNLILRCTGHDDQARPVFQLVLKKVTNELLIIVDTEKGGWRQIPWPDFSEETLSTIPEVNFVGESRALFFGTNYYGIKTSGTLQT